MAEIFGWDAVAANNNSAPPNGAPENMEYDEVNNTMREMYAVLARFIQGSLGGTKTTAGAQPAYTLVSGFTLGAYAAGQVFAFVAHADSTGAVTLNVDGLGAGVVSDSRGNALGSGDIQEDGIYLVTRTAAAFRVIGHLSAASVLQAAGNTLGQAYLATGTANAIVVTTGLFSAYANGQLIAFRAANNNSGACTINIDGLGAEALEDFGSQALATGDIITDRIYLCGRTGGEWRVLTSLPVDLASQVSGILPVANGGTGAASASAARTALGTAYATVAQIRSAASGVVVEAATIESASAAVGLTETAGAIAVDWDAGINFDVTVDQASVISNPTNGQPGTWRTIYIVGNDATDRAITFGNQFLGEVPVITDCDSGRHYLIMIFCRSSTHFIASAKRAFGAA